MSRTCGIDPEKEVASWRDVQGDMMLCEIVHQCRVFYGTYPMRNPLSAKSSERSPDAFRSAEFTGVRCAVQPGTACPLEVSRKGFRRRTGFCTCQSERHDTIVLSFNRHTGHVISHGPGPRGIVPLAHNVKDPIDLYMEVGLHTRPTALHAGEVHVVRHAKQVMRAGGHRDLGIADMLLRHPCTEFVDDLLIVLVRFQAARDHQKDFNEVVKIAIGEQLSQFLFCLYWQ